MVAAETARFWLPEAGLGIIADTASVRLPRMLPPVVANEVLYAGRRLDAAEALRWGLVNAVVTGDDLMPETRALAKRVALSAPLSVAAISEIGRRTAHLGLPEAFELLRSGQLAAYEAMLASDDATEAPARSLRAAPRAGRTASPRNPFRIAERPSGSAARTPTRGRRGDWSTTTAASENITTVMPTNCNSDTSSPRNAQAISVLVTGIASVIVEPTHAGMRASDQFISM